MTIEQLSQILRDNGIVGAGGAGFPTYGKLSEKAETIIMNCAECEPLLKLHRQLLKEHAREILKAFQLVAETVGAKEAIIGIKKEYESTIVYLQDRKLPEWVHRKTIQKAIESYRISDETKTYLRSLR